MRRGCYVLDHGYAAERRHIRGHAWRSVIRLRRFSHDNDSDAPGLQAHTDALRQRLVIACVPVLLLSLIAGQFEMPHWQNAMHTVLQGSWLTANVMLHVELKCLSLKALMRTQVHGEETGAAHDDGPQGSCFDDGVELCKDGGRVMSQQQACQKERLRSLAHVIPLPSVLPLIGIQLQRAEQVNLQHDIGY